MRASWVQAELPGQEVEVGYSLWEDLVADLRVIQSRKMNKKLKMSLMGWLVIEYNLRMNGNTRRKNNGGSRFSLTQLKF